MKVAVRGFAGKRRIFEEIVDVDFDTSDPEDVIRSQVERMLPYPDHMIELEFIEDAPNPYRFFRFGTDPEGMVIPMERE